MRPSSSPAWLIGATPTELLRRQRGGRQTEAHALLIPAPTTGPLAVGQHDRLAARVGYRHRAFQHVARAGIDLGAVKAHGLAQRLGQLEQQLVH
jgi:hypothetical protein